MRSFQLFAKSKFTRESCSCRLFGLPKALCSSKLPTSRDVILSFNEQRRLIGKQSQKGNFDPPFAEIAVAVATQINQLYDQALIPCVSDERVLQMIQTLHDNYIIIKKYNLNLKSKISPGLQKKVDKFKSDSLKLFDISKCKCKTFDSCTCPKDKKVPLSVQAFLKDQRSERKCFIRSAFENETDSPLKNSQHSNYSEQSKQSETSQSSNSQDHYTASPASVKHSKIKFNKTSLIAQRYGVSARATAALASAALEDAGIISTTQKSEIADKNKIRRSIKKSYKYLEQNFTSNIVPVKAVFF